MRKIQYHYFRTRIKLFAGLLNISQRLLSIAQGNCNNMGARQIDSINMYWKRRVRDKCGIAGAEHRKAHMTETLLASNAGQDLSIGVKLDVIFFCVFYGNFFSEIENTSACAVSLVARVLHSLA